MIKGSLKEIGIGVMFLVLTIVTFVLITTHYDNESRIEEQLRFSADAFGGKDIQKQAETTRGGNWDEIIRGERHIRTVYSTQVNINYSGNYIPIEDYITVTEDNGKISIETPENKRCMITLDYTLKNTLDSATPIINITEYRGGHYFTTDIGKNVTEMAYAFGCDGVYDNDRLIILDDIVIDFKMAKKEQNITAEYDSKNKKLNFIGDDLKKIDPTITMNANDTDARAYTQCSGSLPAIGVGNELDSGEYTAIGASDDSRVTSENCIGFSYILMNYSLSSLSGSTIDYVYNSWEGYITGGDQTVDIYAWNFTSSAWVKIGNNVFAGTESSHPYNLTAVGDYVGGYYFHHLIFGDVVNVGLRTDHAYIKVGYTQSQAPQITDARFNDTEILENEAVEFYVNVTHDSGNESIENVNATMRYPNGTLTNISCTQGCSGSAYTCGNYTTNDSCTVCGCEWNSSLSEEETDALYEDFDGGTTGWTLGTWNYQANSATYCVNDDNDDCVYATWLDTNQIVYASNIDLSGCQAGSIYVWYDYYDRDADSGEYLDLMVSNDGGSGWDIELHTNLNGANGHYQINESIADSYAVSNFRVGFDSDDLDYNEFVYVDDIHVHCLLSSGSEECVGDTSYTCGIGTCNTTCGCVKEAVWNITFSDTSQTGTYNVTVVNATDINSNTNQTTYSDVYFNVTSPPSTPPIVILQHPENTTYYEKNQSINYTVSDDDGVDTCGRYIFYVNDEEAGITDNDTIEDCKNITYLFGNFTGYINKVQVWANDSLGAYGNSSMIYFTVTPTPVGLCTGTENCYVTCGDNFTTPNPLTMNGHNITLTGSGVTRIEINITDLDGFYRDLNCILSKCDGCMITKRRG